MATQGLAVIASDLVLLYMLKECWLGCYHALLIFFGEKLVERVEYFIIFAALIGVLR